jgi:hypothetical protein
VPEIINLKGGKVYFGSQFQSFQSMTSGSIAFGSVVKWRIHGMGQSSSPHDGQEAKKIQEGSMIPISLQELIPNNLTSLHEEF